MASIYLENVSLKYPVFGTRAFSLKSGILNLATGGKLVKDCATLEVEALRSVDLDLKNGDRLGLIGHNGAGKTSLLKVLAQIYIPMQGSVKISGRVNCLFDMLMGMDFECTGYENIKLRGLILGLSKKEIDAIVPDIEAFAELGDFMKMPVRTYSSGMLVRLAFGIMTGIRSDILLIDEVIGVGDQQFMEKAKARMAQRIFDSDIMVLSTHDLHIMRKFCNKAAWLEHGQIKVFGSVEEVIGKYERHVSTQVNS